MSDIGLSGFLMASSSWLFPPMGATLGLRSSPVSWSTSFMDSDVFWPVKDRTFTCCVAEKRDQFSGISINDTHEKKKNKKKLQFISSKWFSVLFVFSSRTDHLTLSTNNSNIPKLLSSYSWNLSPSLFAPSLPHPTHLSHVLPCAAERCEPDLPTSYAVLPAAQSTQS